MHVTRHSKLTKIPIFEKVPKDSNNLFGSYVNDVLKYVPVLTQYQSTTSYLRNQDLSYCVYTSALAFI